MKNSICINQLTCKRCGICAEICPNKILEKTNSQKIDIRHDRIELCFKCGQCMAVCPTCSIVTDGLSYETDFFTLPEIEPGGHAKSFYDIIYTRRAIRNFKDYKVPKDLLEQIVEAITFAPPGFPPVKLKIIVVQDKALIRKSLSYMIKLYEYLVIKMKNPVTRFFIKRKVGKKKFKLIQEHLIPNLKVRLPLLKDGTEDTITRNAPAMILFLEGKKCEDIRDDIYIAATYGMLAAHSLGLGGSIMDLIPAAIEKDKNLRKLFHVPEDHQVVTSLIIGYPKYKYQRGVKRSLKSVEWLE